LSAENVKVRLEVDHVVVKAACKLVMDTIAICFALARNVVGALYVPAGSKLDFQTAIQIEDIVDGIIVVAHHSNRPDYKVSVLGDAYIRASRMALERIVGRVFEEANGVAMHVYSRPQRELDVHVLCIIRTVVPFSF
jgi:hypothetical protein